MGLRWNWYFSYLRDKLSDTMVRYYTIYMQLVEKCDNGAAVILFTFLLAPRWALYAMVRYHTYINIHTQVCETFTQHTPQGHNKIYTAWMTMQQLHVYCCSLTDPQQQLPWTLWWWTSLAEKKALTVTIRSASASLDVLSIAILFSCPGSSIPDLGNSVSATFEFWHKEWLLRLGTLQTFDQHDV